MLFNVYETYIGTHPEWVFFKGNQNDCNRKDSEQPQIPENKY